MISLSELFSNFLILRIYVPGLLFTAIAYYLGLKVSYKFPNDGTVLWTVVPLVLGQFVHFFTSATSLLFGFEQIKKDGCGCVPECIQNRVKGKNVYELVGKDAKNAAKLMFYFGQLYSNCFIVLIVCIFLNCGAGFSENFVLLLGAIASLISSAFNYFYGRAVLLNMTNVPAE